MESRNPFGSVKDRIALPMIRAAAGGELPPTGSTIVEATSGNTGIALAWVGAALGYQVVLTMPDTMSEERRRLLQALGAVLELTDGREAMNGAVLRAEEIGSSTPGALLVRQFSNTANPRAHEETTGPEIWAATQGRVDVFVAGVGTGGTISGVGRALRARNPSVEIVAVEPAESPVISGVLRERTQSRESAPDSCRRCWTGRSSTGSKPFPPTRPPGPRGGWHGRREYWVESAQERMLPSRCGWRPWNRIEERRS
jgi:cysteine synthase A